MKKQVWISWSGGKDALMALEEVIGDDRYECCGLICTIRSSDDRVGIHGVPASLIAGQADQLGLEVIFTRLPERPSNKQYWQAITDAWKILKEKGAEGIIYGDINLADIREFRESLHEGSEMEAIFPLWGRETSALAERFVTRGHRAVIVSIDPETADKGWLGKEYDHRFLRGLGQGIDPCGEHGEFHTFVHDSVIFREAIKYEYGGVRMELGYFPSMDLKKV